MDENGAAIEAIEEEIRYQESEFRRLRLLSNTEAEIRMRAHCAAQAEAVQTMLDVLCQRLDLLKGRI